MLQVRPDRFFFDTSSLLIAGEKIFEYGVPAISSITLSELENIKTSSNKDEELKYKARQILRILEQRHGDYEVVIHKKEYEQNIAYEGLGINNDTAILSDAIEYNDWHPDEVIFVTNDLALKNIANLFFGDKMIINIEEENDEYTGYKEIKANDDILAEFYQDATYNYFDLLIGQYLVLKNKDSEVVDLRCWTGTDHRYLNTKPFKSKQLGTIGAIEGDIYQCFAVDSLRNNQVTMLRGRAGSGKSILSLGYLFSELEKHNINQIAIFCNPVATINSARLGFYKGDKDEKLLDSQIGNFLASKLGGKIEIERLINEEKLLLLPFADLRGWCTSDNNIGIYITEAQNLDKTLIKLALQRAGENSKFIIDGDDFSQVDLQAYLGNNNGMRKASQVLRGQDLFGEIYLQKIHRSRLAEIADNI